jgi:branched-chain amino acid transport system permease protein
LGFVVILKATDVFQFAQGDLLMLGAFATATAVVTWHTPVIVGLVAAVALTAAASMLLQKLALRHMVGRPVLSVAMVTLAASLVIENAVILIWGPQPRALTHTLPNHIFIVDGVRLSTLYLIAIGIALLCVAMVGVFFRFTSVGLHMRATAENVEAAALSGVNVGRIFLIAFAIGGAMAGVAGFILANTAVVSLGLSDLGLLAFPAAVVGGLTSVPGAFVGGLLIGIIEQYLVYYVSGTAADAIVYGILLVVLLVRPEGLFGDRSVIRV